MTPTNLDGLFFRITYETIGKKDDETCIFAEDKRHLSITFKQARCSAFDLHYLCKKLITSKYETNNLYSFISYRYLARLLSQEADEHFPRRHTYLFMVCRHHWCGTEGHGQALHHYRLWSGNDSTIIQTQKIQEVIDRCHANGGGVIVVPAGTYLTGSLFFKPGCNLYLEENATLKGSDAITHYQIVKTRLEGQTLDYFAALINADHHDGFTIAGKGTLNGNGHKFYDEFWLRRKVIKKCTNLEALRPRLVYISNSNDVKVSGIRMVNSGFWTNHLYKCKRMKYLNLYIYAPTSGYPKGPSTDAIDIDGCEDMLIRGCWVNVNDDGVCLKGGKGTFVDKDSTNAPCRNVIVENCYFKKAGGGVTFGSECYDAKNVIIRDCQFNGTSNILLFKMRPDTPQKYEDVLAENCTGVVTFGIRTRIWTQFYDKKDRDDMPRSVINNVKMKNIKVKSTKQFYTMIPSENYDLGSFSFENIDVTDPVGIMDTSVLGSCKLNKVKLNGKAIK